MIVLLVVLALGFAFSMGAHYTGACMGMPHALRAISARRALLVMAPLTLLGATFASHKVEHTVGHGLLAAPGLPVTGLVVVIGVAFGLTSLFNVVRIPTSTIQILVFSVVGVGLAADAFSPLTAGLLGGLGLAVGMLTWGRPLLHKVAFDIVTVDRPMATAAQLVQAAVVLAAVAFGFFTSMNQALIGAMTGAAAARGRRTVHAAALYGVLRGWLIGPAAAIALGFGIGWLVSITAGTHALG